MLFTEEQLNQSDPFSILDEAVWLDESESTLQPQMVPITENSSIEGAVVQLNDLDRLCNEHTLSYSEAIDLIAEANDIPSGLIVTAVSEDVLIESPELADVIPQVVVTPLSSEEPISLMVEAVLNEAIESGDTDTMENDLESLAYMHEDTFNKISNALMLGGLAGQAYGSIKNRSLASDMRKAGGKYGMALGQFKVPDRFDRQAKIMNTGFAGHLMFSTGLLMKGGRFASRQLSKLYTSYKDKPRSTIAKVIAKLRSVYSKLMTKAQKGKNPFSKVAAAVLRTIDKLMLAMQRATN